MLRVLGKLCVDGLMDWDNSRMANFMGSVGLLPYKKCGVEIYCFKVWCSFMCDILL